MDGRWGPGGKYVSTSFIVKQLIIIHATATALPTAMEIRPLPIADGKCKTAIDGNRWQSFQLKIMILWTEIGKNK